MTIHRPRFQSRYVLVACVAAFLSAMLPARETVAQSKNLVARDTAYRAKSTHKKRHAAKKAVKAPKRGKVHAKLMMPPPGHDGEAMDIGYMRRRAYPNETVDPEAYPRMLAAAQKMPVLIPGGGKHSTQATTQWQPLGPYTIDGRITCIATHPTDSNTFYVGAASGGLWKTTDHGSSWKCVTDTFGMLSTACVAIDPIQPETIYLGMGEPNGSDAYPGNGLWKSTDGGGSWTTLGFAKSQFLGKILIDPRNHLNVFLAIPGPRTISDSNRGVFHSTDGGASWTRSLLPRNGKLKTSIPVGFIDVAINPLNSGEMVAYAWDASTAVGNFGPSFGPGTGIWRTTDTGTSWNRMDTLASSGLPNGVKYKVLSRGGVVWGVTGDKRDQSVLFAAYTRGDTNAVLKVMTDDNFLGLYRSMDDGLTWTKILDSTYRIPMGGQQWKDSTGITNAQGSYDFYLALHQTYPVPELYIGGIDVIRSNDLGSTWKDIVDGYSKYYVNVDRHQHVDQHGLAFTAATSGTDLLTVSDGGIFHSDDFGQSWNQLTGLPITSFWAIEPWKGGMANTPTTITASDLKMIGGSQDNGTMSHGLTNGNDFSWICQGDGGQIATYAADSNWLVASSEYGAIYARNSLDSLVPNPLGIRDTTHDTRPRWHWLSYQLLKGPHALTDTSEAATFMVPITPDELDPTTLYTGRCRVYRAKIDWNDLENTTWQTWSPPLGGDLAKVSVWGDGDLQAVRTGVRDTKGRPMLWACGANNSTGPAVWRTVVDESRADTTMPKWIPIPNGLPSYYIVDVAPDQRDSLTAFVTAAYAGVGGHVFRTTNGGRNWVSITANLPPAPVNKIIIDTLAEHGDPLLRNRALLVATDVGVYVTTNGGGTWLQLGTDLPHLSITDMKMYKNMLIVGTHGRSMYAIDISDLQASSGVAESAAPSTPTMHVYPNPTTEAAGFRLQWDGSSSRPTSCVLIEESNGKSVTAEIADEGSGSYHVSIPTAVRPGAYIVQLLNGEHVLASSRVTIVQ